MYSKDNIVERVRRRVALMAQKEQRGLILQPGAIGDCILTLPLAEFMKKALSLGGVDMIGHTEYTGIFPGRTSVDGVLSIESMYLHRLFADAKGFDVADDDPLIRAFANYTWIATFLGEPNSDFEQNLIFTVNCSHSTEVVTLSMKPPAGGRRHLTEYYIGQFAEQCGIEQVEQRNSAGGRLIRAGKSDMERGSRLLEELDIEVGRKVAVIQPGSGGRHKAWHIENFLAIARELVSAGMEVVFLLGPAEMERFDRIASEEMEKTGRCASNLPLTDVLAVLSNADSFLGNDSGITHLSAALGIRTVAVFGPTDPAVYGPVGPAVTILRSDVPDFAEAVSENLQQQICRILLA
jgi:heptosyltransferase-3